MCEHKLDSKGRVVLPYKIREKLGEVVYIAKGKEGNLDLYSEEAWSELQEEIKRISNSSMSSQTRNALSIKMNAEKISIDGGGRIFLPAKLRKYARLSQNVKFINLLSHIEIWDKQLWEGRERSFKVIRVDLENLLKEDMTV